MVVEPDTTVGRGVLARTGVGIVVEPDTTDGEISTDVEMVGVGIVVEPDSTLGVMTAANDGVGIVVVGGVPEMTWNSTPPSRPLPGPDTRHAFTSRACTAAHVQPLLGAVSSDQSVYVVAVAGEVTSPRISANPSLATWTRRIPVPDL